MGDLYLSQNKALGVLRANFREPLLGIGVEAEPVSQARQFNCQIYEGGKKRCSMEKGEEENDKESFEGTMMKRHDSLLPPPRNTPVSTIFILTVTLFWVL